jgi:hypothetical protein
VTAAAVPEVLHGARFVPRQQAGRREPLRVTPGAFTAAGLPVPGDLRQHNAYQLSRREGWPWSPAIDAHTRRRGSEILAQDLVAVDCDTSGGGDGFAELGDLAAARGAVLDLAGAVVVRTPGHGSHQPGMHVWWAADPSRPVRTGALPGHPLVEVKLRCTAPGSPGYLVQSVPEGELAMIPRWLSGLAIPPPVTVMADHRGAGGRTPGRLEGIISFLLEAGPGDGRNGRLFWCACRCAEMAAAGELDRGAAETALFAAAEENGHVAKHGPGATRGTIASGFRQARVA